MFWVIRRKPENLIVLLGPFGVTLWRRGAVSFQVSGHFLQVVFGDWWKAQPIAKRSGGSV